jgi:hypothetical protein
VKDAIKPLIILLAVTLLLLAASFGGRWLWYHPGRYTPPEIPTVDPGIVAVATLPPATAEPEPESGDGVVVIDQAHGNNLDVNDLTPLRDRLNRRGVDVELWYGGLTNLKADLRRASAFVVLVPSEGFYVEEREAIVDFVADGGKVLLAADPTRAAYTPSLEDLFWDPGATGISAVPAINSLSGAFDVIFFDDYLYNLENENRNYRNVAFTRFEGSHALTEGLDEVIFFASHSLRTQDRPLITGDADTRSAVRIHETELHAATLSAEERVLALGDITFLTAPYHAYADNDAFLSRIADWLARDERQREELADFPYLLEPPIDLVQINTEVLDPQLIHQGGILQQLFADNGLDLQVRTEAVPEHDTLHVGLFPDYEPIQEILATAGISIVIELNETETDVPAQPEWETPSNEEAENGEAFPPEAPLGVIVIEDIGRIPTQGTTLFVLDRREERTDVVVLAERAQGVAAGVERLVAGALDTCLNVSEAVVVCSTGESLDSDDLGAVSDVGKPEVDQVLILAFDTAFSPGRTSASELQTSLSPDYAVTIWSLADRGLPTDVDLQGYRAYIVDSGDYALEDATIVPLMGRLGPARVMWIGSQILSLPDQEMPREPLTDLRVADAAHALAAGFAEDAIITLGPSESGAPATVISTEDFAEETGIPFVRGPESVENGAPVVVSYADIADPDYRTLFAAFAFYRLPREAQSLFAQNAMGWLMEE